MEIINQVTERMLRRHEAAAFLQENGFKVATSTLAKLRPSAGVPASSCSVDFRCIARPICWSGRRSALVVLCDQRTMGKIIDSGITTMQRIVAATPWAWRRRSVGAPPLVSAANPRRRGVLSGRVINQTPKRRLGCLDLQVSCEREGQNQTLQTAAAPERANQRRRCSRGPTLGKLASQPYYRRSTAANRLPGKYC